MSSLPGGIMRATFIDVRAPDTRAQEVGACPVALRVYTPKPLPQSGKRITAGSSENNSMTAVIIHENLHLIHEYVCPMLFAVLLHFSTVDHKPIFPSFLLLSKLHCSVSV